MSKILVVDDDERIAVLIKRMLQVHNHEVLVANNGKDGLKQAVKAMPDLIIADIIMPDMDGLEMLQKIKDLKGHTWSIPVIMLTGVDPEKAMRRAMHSFAECYLVKPVDEASLMAVVTRILAVRKPMKKPTGFLPAALEWLRLSFSSSGVSKTESNDE
jgi:DNA-binding response OmpR family regulator